MMGALSVTLCMYYFYMRHILNNYFSNSLLAEKRKINILFATFLFAYTLRTLTSLLQPYYNEAVCQVEVRWVISSTLRSFFIYTAILSMLIFHHQSFKSGKQEMNPELRESHHSKPDEDNELMSATSSVFSSTII
jgi:hypothetical protein